MEIVGGTFTVIFDKKKKMKGMNDGNCWRWANDFASRFHCLGSGVVVVGGGSGCRFIQSRIVCSDQSRFRPRPLILCGNIPPRHHLWSVGFEIFSSSHTSAGVRTFMFSFLLYLSRSMIKQNPKINTCSSCEIFRLSRFVYQGFWEPNPTGGTDGKKNSPLKSKSEVTQNRWE